jgi:hypothetical protein
MSLPVWGAYANEVFPLGEEGLINPVITMLPAGENARRVDLTPECR